jgi:hypothetical protein
VAKVLLLSAAPNVRVADPTYNSPLKRLQACVPRDRFGVHGVVDDPLAADVILFVEYRPAGRYLHDVRSHRYVLRHREKCFTFCSEDAPIPFLPGVYPSIEARWHDPRRTASGHYLRRLGVDPVPFDPLAEEARPYLFSFVGRLATAPVRGRLRALDGPASPILATDAEEAAVEAGTLPRGPYWERFADVVRRSAFVLCPRGYGPGSMRLFEAMAMGRAPVILSDAWVAPEGPEWERFALRVPERRAADLPAILAAASPHAVEMGRLARAAWEAWFSPEVSFHRLVEACLALRSRRVLPERLARLPAALQVLRPTHTWPYLREVLIRHGVSDLLHRRP